MTKQEEQDVGLAEQLRGHGFRDEDITELLGTRIVVRQDAVGGVKMPLLAGEAMICIGFELSADPADLARLAQQHPGGGYGVIRPARVVPV